MFRVDSSGWEHPWVKMAYGWHRQGSPSFACRLQARGRRRVGCGGRMPGYRCHTQVIAYRRLGRTTRVWKATDSAAEAFFSKGGARDGKTAPGWRGGVVGSDGATSRLQSSGEAAERPVRSEPPWAAASGLRFPREPELIFGNWREALQRSGLSPGRQSV